jgi:capsule polysaccharide export protein KpsC/LpsZ
VLWDANMFFGRDLFDDQEHWFIESVRGACANDRVNWIVKLHPANVWKRKRDHVSGELDEHVAIREHIGALPPHVRLLEPDTDISTWSLFDVTDYGLTIRGSIGFELPCFGKPALTAGTGFYTGRGFTVDSETPDEYLGRLAQIHELDPPSAENVELAKKHAYALFTLRQTRFTSFRSVFKPLEEIDDPYEATIEVKLRSADELAQAEDLRRLGEWAVRSRELDYLEL